MTNEVNLKMRHLVKEIAAIPYVWPGDPWADAVRETGTGTCASKHALLREELTKLGIASHPVFVAGPLVPTIFMNDPRLQAARGLLEVHELLSVSVPQVGPCRVDVTWDPPLVKAGLPGQIDWDGKTDMQLAVGETSLWWVPDTTRLRDEKEALRQRLYRPGERQIRDASLSIISELVANLREPSS